MYKTCGPVMYQLRVRTSGASLVAVVKGQKRRRRGEATGDFLPPPEVSVVVVFCAKMLASYLGAQVGGGASSLKLLS